MHWRTLQKILQHSQPPGYRQQAKLPKPKLGDYLEKIDQILKEDLALPKKQRHTAKRIFERLQELGYQGGYTEVKEAVRERREQSKEVYVPLEHRPGEAQVDFGYALVKMEGVFRKVALAQESLNEP